MKQKHEHPNPPCGAHRSLTRKELEAIVAYDLHPRVERCVDADWKSRLHPRIKEKKKERNIVRLVSKSINYLLPVLLFLLYVDPMHTLLITIAGTDGLYIAGSILKIGIIFSWIYVALSLPIMISDFVIAANVRLDPWNPVYLSIWRNKYSFGRCIGIIFQLGTMIGLLLNEWYVLAICMMLAYTLMYFSRRRLRKLIGMHMHYLMKEKS